MNSPFLSRPPKPVPLRLDRVWRLARPCLALAMWPALTLLALAWPVAGQAEVSLSAYYYPWYGADRRHWELGYDGEKGGRRPALGEYDSRDPATIRRHLDFSRQLGISRWICSWWGPDSWEDETLRLHVLPELAHAAAPGAEPPLTFCLFYESEGLLGLDPEAGIPFDEAKTETFAEHFRWMAEHYFSHPCCHRIDGKPVVFLYLSRAFSGHYDRALAKARAVAAARGFEIYLVGDEVYWGEPDPARLRLLDAVTAYNMHGPLEFAGLDDWTPFVEACGEVYRRWRTAAAEQGVAFIPGVLPGFDSSGTAPGAHYSIPRRLRPGAGPASTLEAMAAMARQHLDPRLNEVALTSFNEWHEGTQLEPSREGNAEEARVIREVFGPAYPALPDGRNPSENLPAAVP